MTHFLPNINLCHNFCAAALRTYNILKEKTRRFNVDPEIQALLQEINGGESTHANLFSGGYSKAVAEQIKAIDFQPDRLAQRGFKYEKLDQLTVELLLGVR